jgi:hypothetical protein
MSKYLHWHLVLNLHFSFIVRNQVTHSYKTTNEQVLIYIIKCAPITTDTLKPCKSKKRVKQSHYTPWRRLGGEETYLLLIHDLGTRWGEWSVSRPGRALPPVLIGQEAGWAPEPVWTQRIEEKSFAPAGD